MTKEMNRRFQMLASAEDFAEYSQAARAAGVSVGAWLRMCADRMLQEMHAQRALELSEKRKSGTRARKRRVS